MTNDSPAATSDARPSRWSLLGSTLGPFLALALVVGIFGVADHFEKASRNRDSTFLTSRNVRAIAAQTAVVAVAALGMTVVIISGGIDLSAGTAVALAATVLAWSLKEDVALLITQGDNVASAQEKVDSLKRELSQVKTRLESAPANEAQSLEQRRSELGSSITKAEEKLERVIAASPTWTPWTPTIALLLAVATGCGCGLLNGLLISALRVGAFIVTLGTMTLFLGLAKMLANETTVRPVQATQVPEWLSSLLSIRNDNVVWGLPLGVWIVLGLALLLAGVLRYTVFGRYVFALGSNEATARLCGINVFRNKVLVYVLAGLFVGFAGVCLFARLSVGNPTSGTGLELKIIAAVVIGGGSLSGGRGSVLGTLTGAAIMEVISSGCTQLGLDNPVQDIILGVIIIAAVATDQARQRRLR